MQLSLNPDEKEFQAEVRTFLRTQVPEEYKQAERCRTLTSHRPEIVRGWMDLTYRHGKGWGTPLWPKEVGGPGFTPVQRFIFEYECGMNDAPIPSPQSVRYIGPLIIKYGSQAQKDFFLPKIQTGEHLWTQGYSEPGAGSDLAALKTRAVREGDHYVVNGQKVWTTDAHHADWVFALVRTTPSEKKQDGISVLLIDMKSPGVTVRPIITLAGNHETNEVFFDNVKVPVENLVGEQDKGWGYGKYILEFERGGQFAVPRIRRLLQRTEAIAPPTTEALAKRFAQLHAEVDALTMMELRHALASQDRGSVKGAGPSVMKLKGSQLRQAVTRLGVDSLGARGLQWGAPRSANDPIDPGLEPEALAIMERHLNFRAWTIFAGASEIQREIISKEVLG